MKRFGRVRPNARLIPNLGGDCWDVSGGTNLSYLAYCDDGTIFIYGEYAPKIGPVGPQVPASGRG